MKKQILIGIIVGIGAVASGQSLEYSVRAYMIQNDLDPALFGGRGAPAQIIVREGEPVLVWDARRLSGVLRPSLPGETEPSEADLPSLEDALQIIADYDAALELERQQAKPQAQKTYENAFFDLIDELLVLVDDPQDPTPKLGFPELQALIAQVQATDPTTAVNLSLNLLTIDAALKRYDTMWWDNAVRHEITPE